MSESLPCNADRETEALFFSDSPEDQRKAAALCFGCPLFEACAEKGKTEEYGVWGGKTQWDRPNAPALARKAERERKARIIAARDERIYYYARVGWTHAEIAQDFNLGEITVKAIVRRRREAHRKLAAA